MNIRVFGPLVIFCLFVPIAPAFATIYGSFTVFLLTSQDEVRANTSATSELQDEMDKLYVEVILYYEAPLGNQFLDSDSGEDIRVGTETLAANANALYSPLSPGCKYCGEATWQTFRDQSNQGSQPIWVLQEQSDWGPNCKTAPTGGGGPGGGGNIP